MFSNHGSQFVLSVKILVLIGFTILISACVTGPSAQRVSRVRSATFIAGNAHTKTIELSGSSALTMPILDSTGPMYKYAMIFNELQQNQTGLESDIQSRYTSLESTENTFGNKNLGLTLTGIGISIASVALVASNPAAHAALIAGLGAGGGGLVTFQSVMANEGLTSHFYEQREAKITAAWNIGFSDYSTALGKSTDAILSSDAVGAASGINSMIAAQGEEALAINADAGMMPGTADSGQILSSYLSTAIGIGQAAQSAAVSKIAARDQIQVADIQQELQQAKTQLATDQSASPSVAATISADNATIAQLQQSLQAANSQLTSDTAIANYLSSPSTAPPPPVPPPAVTTQGGGKPSS